MPASPTIPISILLVEDHALVREGLRALLEIDEHLLVVGEASNGREAVELADKLRPDVILMDIAMPVLNGFEATKQILAADPDARVLVLSAHSEDIYIERMNEIGTVGFLEKRTSGDILLKAIRTVAEGGTFFSPVIAKRLHHYQFKTRDEDDLPDAHGLRLTTRESEVLQLVAEGLANKQVAAELGISVKTVEKHRQRIMDKLNVHNTANLTRYAVGAGIVENPAPLNLG